MGREKEKHRWDHSARASQGRKAAPQLESAPAIRKGYLTSDTDCQACQADVNSSENSDFFYFGFTHIYKHI